MTDPSAFTRLLAQAPVMGPLHPLQALCLPPATEVVSSARRLAEEMDNPAPQVVRPVWLTDVQPSWAHRFLQADASTPPPLDAVNHALPGRLGFARQNWLTHRAVANQIVNDTIQHRYRTVALLLVDGLSYFDVQDWPENASPCLIDGPSITYYRDSSTQSILPDIGFPGIVGTPRLARRLIDLGLLYSRGFSYWSSERNDVSAVLFDGIPLTTVSEFSDAVAKLSDADLECTYVQVVREGLDGLAHHRREVSLKEIHETVQAIRADALALFDVLRERPAPVALYLVADHGILWKTESAFETLETDDHAHPRYGLHPPLQERCATQFGFDELTFYVYHGPYLGATIPSNNSGVHGGLSAQESIVPFVRWEKLQ